MLASLALLLPALSDLPVAAALAAATGIVAPPETGQALSEGALIDYDYAFELRRATDDWQMLGEADAGAWLAGALAGTARSDECMGFVTCEPAPKAVIDDMQNWIVEQIPVGDRTVGKRGLIPFQGEKALHATGSGNARGGRVRFQVWAFLHRNLLYTLYAQGPLARLALDAPELNVFADGFKLRPEVPKPRAYASDASTDRGPGWSRNGSHYRNALLGFELRAPERWRVLSGDALRSRAPDAVVGIACGNPRAELYLHVDRIAADQAKSWKGALPKSFSNMDPEADATNKPRSVLLDKCSLPLKKYKGRTGAPYEYLYGNGTLGELGLRAVGWCCKPESDKAFAALRSALGGFALLPKDARAADLLAMLAGGEDRPLRAGRGAWLRGGVYVDATHAFQWEMPPGCWQAELGTDETEGSAQVALEFRDPTRNLRGRVLIYESDNRVARWVMDSYFETMSGKMGSPEKPVKFTKIKAGLAEFNVRSMAGTFEGLPSLLHVAGTNGYMRAESGTGFVALFVLFGSKQGVLDMVEPLRRSLEGFRWLYEKPLGPRRVDGVWTDERMGYRIALPPGDWKLDDARQPADALSSRAVMRRGALRVYALAYAGQGRAAGTDTHARLLREELGKDWGGIDWAKPAQSSERMGGFACDTWRCAGPAGSVELNVLRCPGLTYVLGLAREGGAEGATPEFQSLREAFGFLPPPERPASEPVPLEPPASQPKPESQPVEADAGPADSKSDAKPDAKPPEAPKAPPYVLDLPVEWRGLRTDELSFAAELLPAFASRPDWCRTLLDQKLLTRGAKFLRPPLLGLRRAADGTSAPDLLQLDCFYKGAKAGEPGGFVKSVSDLLSKAGAGELGARTLDGNAAGMLHCLTWLEPAAKSAAAASAKAPAPLTNRAYLLIVDERVWVLSLRLARAPLPDEGAELDKLALAFKPGE